MLTFTTIEESKRLLDLGISSDTADMHYYALPVDCPVQYSTSVCIGKPSNEDLPCWTESALLDLLPDHIGEERLTVDKVEQQKVFESNKPPKVTWRIYYQSGDVIPFVRGMEYGGTLFSAAYKMLVWLKEENKM